MGAQLCCVGVGRGRDGFPFGRNAGNVTLQKESEDVLVYGEDLSLVEQGTPSMQEYVAAAVLRRSQRQTVAPAMAALSTHEQHLQNMEKKRKRSRRLACNYVRLLYSVVAKQQASQHLARTYLRLLYSSLAKRTPSLEESVSAAVHDRSKRRSEDVINLARRSSLDLHTSNLDKIRTLSAASSPMCIRSNDAPRHSQRSRITTDSTEVRTPTLQDDLAVEYQRRTIRLQSCASKLSVKTEAALIEYGIH